VTDFDEARAIESMVDRLFDQFPGVPAASVHEVVAAAWAEFSHNPVRDVISDLVERAARQSLERFPVPPSSPADPAETVERG
jgi:hypothetical protein